MDDPPPNLRPRAVAGPALTRRSALAALLSGAMATPLAACAARAGAGGSRLLHEEDFSTGLSRWSVEAERPARVRASRGRLDVDAPAGVTLWFRARLEGPVAIELAITAVQEGGPNDSVSDANFFWMATDPAAPAGSVLERPRSGRFGDYDTLLTYYAGLGGNRNTTSRFRRYVGRRDERPLLSRHDLSAASELLVPNREMQIRLVAAGERIALIRDGRVVFQLDDPAPYRRGHFGLRTTQSHLRVRRMRIWRL